MFICHARASLGQPKLLQVINRAKRSKIRVVGEKDGHTEYSIESGEGLGVGKGSVRNIW